MECRLANEKRHTVGEKGTSGNLNHLQHSIPPNVYKGKHSSLSAASRVVEMKSSSEKGRYLQVGELKDMKCYDNLIIICHQSYSNSQSNATLIGH